jgi:hypothetical protein
MLLAGILALWMLPGVPASGTTGGSLVFLTADRSSFWQQDSSQTPAPVPQGPSSQTTAPADKSTPTPPKHKHKKKPAQPPSSDSSDTPSKKVVTHGSTQAPTTHLSQSLTDEESLKAKAANTDLLNQAGSNLQKVSSRTLTDEQKETADQVRKFIEQSKTADQEGDLQRAGTLANKAKLLSDSLEETSRPK